MTMFDPVPSPSGRAAEPGSPVSSAADVSVEATFQEKNPNAPTGSAPFRSGEDFGTYCDQVQRRLARHAVERRHFLQTAFERLTILLQTAHAVEDRALCAELKEYREAAGELLETLNRFAPGASMDSAPTSRPSLPAAQFGENGRYLAGSRLPAPAMIGMEKTRTSRTLAPGEHRAPLSSSLPGQTILPEPDRIPGPRLPRRAVRPLADIKADAIRLRETVRDSNEKLRLLTEGGELNVVNCLRLRAIACRQRRLEEEAGDTEVAEVIELANDIIGQLDAADDQEYTVALDYELTPAPTAYQWGELAERYEEMSRAQEAFEWWVGNNGLLTVNDVQPLAEAVAAVQQRFNRLLFRIGARDPFQQQLFDDLRAWAREAQCYLQSLRPKVPMMELVERAMTLEPAWANVRAALEENQGQLAAPQTEF